MRFFLSILVLLIGTGCRSSQTPKAPAALHSRFQIIEKGSIEDSAVAQLLQPYEKKLEHLNEVIGHAPEDIRKGQPEGSLGNLIADMVRESSAKLFGMAADICVLNNGGFRVPISKGAISRGTVFELMPFENALVMVSLSGRELLQVAEKIASAGGQPVSGLSMEFTSDRKPSEIKVGLHPLDPQKNYQVITTDYLAQGNNGLFGPEAFDRSKKSGVLLRDLIIEKILELKFKPLTASIDGRIKAVSPP